MRYYLDCEFNGMGGELLSLALVRKNGEWLYLVNKLASAYRTDLDPWVAKNVVPLLGEVPDKHPLMRCYQECGLSDFPQCIEHFLAGYPEPTIIADRPDDIKYFCELMITGPGERIDTGGLEAAERTGTKFEIHRVDSYPTDLPGAVQHNAFWDAMVLRHKLQGAS